MSESGSLLNSQTRFAAAVRNADQAEATASLLHGDATLNQRRLAIYRGNVVASISKALALAYPVIEQVLGSEFFAGLARTYWEQTPSTSGNLHEYGADLPSFIAHFPHTQPYPYLPDLARLEWAVHLAESAADAQSFNAARLAGVSEEQLPHLRFQFTPGLTLLESAYPVVQIWQVHQAEVEDFEIDWSCAQTALIYREGFKVAVTDLDIGNAAALSTLLNGQPLAAALDAAFMAEANFDFQNALGLWLTRGWVQDIVIEKL